MRKSFDQLKRISLLLTAIYVALVLFPVTAHAGSGFFGAEANRAAVLRIYIDKTNQQMTVSLDGAENIDGRYQRAEQDIQLHREPIPRRL